MAKKSAAAAAAPAEQPQVAAPTTETASSPQITITDLQDMVKVIDAAAERGSWRGPELSQIGALRDRLHAFVSAALAAQSQALAQQEAAAATDAPAA